MKKTIKLILIVVLIGSFTASPDQKINETERPLTTDEIINAVILFENIMNKDIPSMDDFNLLHYGEAESDNEGMMTAKYCSQIMNIKPDTPACNDALKDLINSITPRPSLYLNDTKNLLTDGAKSTVKIYISPHIEYCKNNNRGLINVNALAILENMKYKTLKLAFPCTTKEFKYWKIGVEEINGLKITQYPFTIRKPFEKRH
jgi:hypothetical protein